MDSPSAGWSGAYDYGDLCVPDALGTIHGAPFKEGALMEVFPVAHPESEAKKRYATTRVTKKVNIARNIETLFAIGTLLGMYGTHMAVREWAGGPSRMARGYGRDSLAWPA
jgi:hypothetical protein